MGSLGGLYPAQQLMNGSLELSPLPGKESARKESVFLILALVLMLCNCNESLWGCQSCSAWKVATSQSLRFSQSVGVLGYLVFLVLVACCKVLRHRSLGFSQSVGLPVGCLVYSSSCVAWGGSQVLVVFFPGLVALLENRVSGIRPAWKESSAFVVLPQTTSSPSFLAWFFSSSFTPSLGLVAIYENHSVEFALPIVDMSESVKSTDQWSSSLHPLWRSPPRLPTLPQSRNHQVHEFPHDDSCNESKEKFVEVSASPGWSVRDGKTG